MFPLYVFLLFAAKTFASPDTITFGQSLTDGKTIVSANGRFELGFFNRSNSKNHYVGIWYKLPSPDKVVVWVANRETPLNDSLGVLSLTPQGILVLDGKNRTIWSSNKAVKSEEPVLQLLDTGNLVVKDGNGSNSSGLILWQSFDYPCDTFLPEMKLGRNRKTGQEAVLTSWKSADNPGKGKFSLLIDPSGFPQLVVRNGNMVHYRLGPWNGLRFSGTPELPQNQFLKLYFVLNESGVHYWYEGLNSLISRLVVNRTGFLERFGWLTQSQTWQLFYSAPRDACDNYSFCGPYMSCNMIDERPNCDCLEGFARKSSSNLSDGCVRKDRLDCKNEMFRPYTGMKLPDTSSSSYNTSMSLQECKELCLKNCSCVAYANSNITGEGIGCIHWFSDLVDMRKYYEGGQDLYIRMSSSKSETRRLKLGIAIGSAILAGTLITGLVWCTMNRKQRKQGLARSSQKNDYISPAAGEDMELPIFDLNVLVKATDNFSNTNKLGKGGFGPVYKGTLSDGQEIAVKRLSKSSRQGLTEFKNEVILIAKLQHRNLVKLLGCCIQGDEKMLVYEFMPNKSLDNFIFDQTRSSFLNWERRFQIIGGIARGLLYLHQDSRLRIIHRDLKAGNVLLDKDMNPKISDFGMARMFGEDEVGADTNKVVGTYGYMAPEYAIDGHFSIKSDVFSFGVLVLEIVTGKKNRGFSHPDHSLNLLGHAWKLWMEDKSLELVDNSLNDYVASQVIRCIHVGLLCVQQRAEDRPEMSSVVVMLRSENSLPEPKHPGFFIQRDIPEPETSSSKHELCSANDMSITLLEPR